MAPTNKVTNLKVVKNKNKETSKVSALSPREIVSELDRYVIGQKDAKKAVAVALRNRWRRQALEGDLKEEVLVASYVWGSDDYFSSENEDLQINISAIGSIKGILTRSLRG